MTAREKAADGEVTRGSRNRDLGRRGEEAAGEADIIARVGEVLVFVEVKTRRGVSYGFPAEAVDEAKRERYRRIALSYLAERRLGEVPLRFDVVSIVVSDRRAVVRHHINAFEAS